MNSIPSTPTTDSTGSTWVRMRFRKNKVWVEAGTDGHPLQKGGRVRISTSWTSRTSTGQTAEREQHPRGVEDAPPSPELRPRERIEPSPIQPQAVSCTSTPTEPPREPGAVGIGVVLQCGLQRKEISEFIGEATNNIAELLAIQKGLAAVKTGAFRPDLHGQQLRLWVLALEWKPQKNTELIAPFAGP